MNISYKDLAINIMQYVVRVNTLLHINILYPIDNFKTTHFENCLAQNWLAAFEQFIGPEILGQSTSDLVISQFYMRIWSK